MNATSTPTAADGKRRPSSRTLLHRHLDSLKRHGGTLAKSDGCLCHPRARAHHDGFHWIAARDPRTGELVWSWIKLFDGVAWSPHDLDPDTVTRALENWLVRKRDCGEPPAVTADPHGENGDGVNLN